MGTWDANEADGPLDDGSGRGWLLLVRRFVEGSYLYILSALLMMAGCYLLMRSPYLTGTEFVRMAKALALLQGYEIAVILTSIAIVRRFRTAGDAFTLLLVEYVLLFDPTFFTNNLFTLLRSDRPTALGAGVNVIAFVLVPLKLLVLSAALRLALRPRLIAACTVAAAFVYLAPGLLCLGDPTRQMLQLHLLLLGWGLVLVGATACGPEEALDETRRPEGLLTLKQRDQLREVLTVLPLGLACLHSVETAFVHKVIFNGALAAPVLLAWAALLTHRVRPSVSSPGTWLGIDTLVAVALVLSLPLQDSMKGFPRPDHPWFRTFIPLAMAGGAAAFVYLLLYLRTRSPLALLRLGVLGLGVVAWGVHAVGLLALLERGLQGLGNALLWVLARAWENVVVVSWVGSAAFLAVALWRRNTGAVLLWGLATIALATATLPKVPEAMFLRAFTAGLLWILIFEHFSPWRSGAVRAILATLACLLGWLAATMPAPWTDVVPLWVTLVCLAVAGVLLRELRFLVPAGATVVLHLGVAAREHFASLPPAMVLVALSVLCFGAGLLITFQRERLLALLPTEGPDGPRPPRRQRVAELAGIVEQSFNSPPKVEAPAMVIPPEALPVVTPVNPPPVEETEPRKSSE